MDHLIAGYRRYRREQWPRLRALHHKLARGQRPQVLVIGCSDSRVDPATIFNADPGELFVVRNVANLAPPYEEGGGHSGTSAAIEFAVERLQVQTILVLGHADCGGVAAALAREVDDAGAEAHSAFDTWVRLLDPAKARIKGLPGDPARLLERESIKVTLENLTSFPLVARRVAEGSLTLVGAHYGIADGVLECYDSERNVFAAIE